MFNGLVDFAEEPTGFKILYTPQSSGLHVSLLWRICNLFLVYRGKVHMMGIYSLFFGPLCEKNIMCLFYIKSMRKGNQLNFKLQVEV
jgi:hypothetical protein